MSMMIGLGFLGAAIFALLGAMLVLYVQNMELKQQNRELAKRVLRPRNTKMFDLEVTKLEKGGVKRR